MKRQGSMWAQVLAASTASIAVFSSCTNTGWANPFVPQLLAGQYSFKITNEEASYVTIIFSVGSVIGSIIAAVITDLIGRQKSILLTSLPCFLAFLIIFLSYYAKELLYVGRILAGVSEGMCFAIVPLYVAEIAEKEVRGMLGTMIAMTHIGGMLFINVIGSYLSIRDSALVCMAFPLVFLVTFWKMPESPYYLLMKNEKGLAEKSLKFLRRTSDVTGEILSLSDDVRRQTEDSGSYKEIFTIDVNRRAFLIISFVKLTQAGTGFIAFTQYTQMLFKDATDVIDPQTGASIVLVVQLFMATVSSMFFDRFGRRPVLIASALLTFLNLLLQAIYFTLNEQLNVALPWFPLLMMIVFTVVFSFGLLVGTNIVVGEYFSASIKSKAACLTNVEYGISMILTTKFYQATADRYGLSVPFWGFATCTFFGLLFIYFCLLETKGKSLEEIQQSLRRKTLE